MAGPITWRTVQGASLADASRPMEVAQRSISAAFGGLGSLVSEQQQLNQNVVDAGREANVQTLLERLQNAESVDDVAALKSSGELDKLRSALTPKDLVRVRGAEENRAAALMQQAIAQRAFTTGEAAAKAAPIKDQILASYMSGDPAKQTEARSILAANPGLPGMADIVKTMVDFDQTKATRDFQAKLNPIKLQEAEQNLATSKSTAAYQEEQRKALADQRAALAAQAKLDAELARLDSDGNMYSKGVLKESDAVEIADVVTKAGVKDPGARAAIIKAIFENSTFTSEGLDANGKKVEMQLPIPKSVALQAALSARGGRFIDSNQWNGLGTGTSYYHSTKDAIQEGMKELRQYTRLDGKEAKLSKAAMDLRAFEDALRRRQEAAPVVPLKPK